MSAAASKTVDAERETKADGNDYTSSDAADAKATALLQKVLSAIRPARKDSPSFSEKLHIFIHEWRTNAGLRSEPLSSKGKALRKEYMKPGAKTEEAMKLFADADEQERAVLRTMIDKLGSAAGRASLINSDDAHHDAATDAQPCEASIEMPTEDCIPAAGTPVTFRELSSSECVHLNGTSGLILGYAACVERYIVRCESGQTVRVRRGNINVSAATISDLVGSYQAMHSQDDVQLLRSVHGEQSTCALIQTLLPLPNRAWTVTDDLWLIAEVWRVRAGA